MASLSEEGALVRAGLKALGKQDLLLAVHDASFPADPQWDLGRGTPYSAESQRFLGWVTNLGFTGVQLGPQGMMEPGSASPYEAALFSRNLLNLDPQQLIERKLVTSEEVDSVLRERPPTSRSRADHRFAYAAATRLSDLAARRADSSISAFVSEWADQNQAWLEPDALYEVIGAERRERWYRRWSGAGVELDQRLFAPLAGEERAAAERRAELRRRPEYVQYAFVQALLWGQSLNWRQETRALELKTFGDFQVGLSARDTWARASLLMRGYLLGAPPSRTNPEGQPWGYPVLDPEQYGTPGKPGPALAFQAARVDHLLESVDGLRLDHPHGLICPWVYRGDEPDPLAAVQNGARLFSSPGLPNHPALARFAIARWDQLNPERPRYADDWVTRLTDEQVARYAVQIDAIVDRVRARGLDPSSIPCEVLSTLPYPIKRVLDRHGLGRFRVTQKASLTDRSDVYRPENARPEDWIMLGNHDTLPIWRVARTWRERGLSDAWASDVAERIEKSAEKRPAVARELSADDGALVNAMLADALASPARHLSIFFTDLFGHLEPYNVPGTVDDRNWSLRITSEDIATYPSRRASLRALNLPRAIATALVARGSSWADPLVRKLAEMGRASAPDDG